MNRFHSNHPEIERKTAVKFILGRKFDIDRAESLLQNFQKAIKARNLQTLTIMDVLDELRTQKMYIPGTRDKNGAALFVINAAKHVSGEFEIEESVELAYFLSELVTSEYVVKDPCLDIERLI